MSLFHTGDVLEFSYPTDNRIWARTRLTRRRLAVVGVRDLERSPLERWTVWRDPWLRRGRYLLRGYDLDLRRFRSFYLESTRSLRELNLPTYRLGHYDPLDLSRPAKLVGPIFGGDDLAAAKETLRILRDIEDPQLHRAFGLFLLNSCPVPRPHFDLGSRARSTGRSARAGRPAF